MFDRLISGLICDPVDFPGLASIIRVGLLEVSRIRGDLRPNKSNIDGSALPLLPIVKLAATILELADHRLNGLAQRRIRAVSPINAPLTGLRIVNTQSQTFNMTCWAVGFKFLQIGAAVPNLSRYRRAIEFDPGFGANQAVLEARQMNLPGTDLEIKIVLTIRRRAGVLRSCPDFLGATGTGRSIRFLLQPCVGGDPVDLPGLSIILRERLFKTARSRSDV